MKQQSQQQYDDEYVEHLEELLLEVIDRLQKLQEMIECTTSIKKNQ